MSNDRGEVVRRSFLFLICFGSVAVLSAENTWVELIRYSGNSVNTSALRFCWHAFKDAREYSIEIADNPDFGCSFIEFVNDTCVAYDMELDEGVWYWRVSSTDHYLSHSPADSVKVSTTLTARVNAESKVPTSPSSNWTYLVNGRRFSEDPFNGAQAMRVSKGATGKGKASVGSLHQSIHRAE